MDSSNISQLYCAGSKATLSVAATWLQDELTTIHLEIGSSRGDFLCSLAEVNRNHRFIGVEIDQAKCFLAVEKAVRLKLGNTIFVQNEGYDFVSKNIPNGSIAFLHVYFPTPFVVAPFFFEKLGNEKFFLEAYRVLRPSGIFRIVTDHEDYFSEMQAALERSKFWFTEWTSPGGNIPEGYYVNTPLERKFRREAKKVYYFNLVRS